MAKQGKVKAASRQQLIVWLARAMQYVPLNNCTINPFEMPARWYKDAKAELKRNGITLMPTKKERKRCSGK